MFSCCQAQAAISFGSRRIEKVMESMFVCEHFWLCAIDSNSFWVAFSNKCVCVPLSICVCSVLYVCACPRSICICPWICPWSTQIHCIWKVHPNYNSVQCVVCMCVGKLCVHSISGWKHAVHMTWIKQDYHLDEL